MTNGSFGEPDPAPTRMVADFGAALDVFKTLMGRLSSTGLLGAFVLMGVASIVANIPLWIAQYLRARAAQQLAQGELTDVAQYALLGNMLNLITALLMVVIIAARLGLARPMRMVVLEDPSSVTSTGEALRLALSGFAPNLGITIVYGLAISTGSCLCFLPGIVAAVLLYPATYLVATGRDFGDSLSMSVDWVSRHTGALLGTIGVLFAVGLVLFCCNCGLGGALGAEFGPMTLVYVLPAGTVLGELLSVFTLTFLASGCIAADQAESAFKTAPPAGPF